MAGTSKHTENYRVVQDSSWPRTADSTHNARYFDDYEQARMAYLHLLMTQAMEERFLERISFDCRCDADGTYSPMFESFQLHTFGSYGMMAQG